MKFTRRQFLKTSLAASAAGAIPSIWWRTAQALQPCESGVNLVIVHIAGGNDGINMVIPMSDGSKTNRTTYNAARPYIGVPVSELTATQIHNDPLSNGQLALHPHFIGPSGTNGLQALYNSGNMAVAVGVHYPNKNLSHDDSSNIWYRADPTLDNGTSGWMGRTLDQLCTGQSTAVPAVDMNDQLTPLFYGNTSVLAFNSLGSLNLPFSGDIETRFTNIVNAASTAGTNFVKPIGAAAYASITKINAYQMANPDLALNLNDILNGTNNGGKGHGVSGYPQGNSLASGLRDVYALMRGGPPGTPLGCRVFCVVIGGFDTHSQQGMHVPLSTESLVDKVKSDRDNGNQFRNQEYHGRLMHRVSNAIAAFWDDCKSANANLHKNTLIMTFSEFGRAVAENGADDSDSGTDHSTAAPVFVIGPTQTESNVGHWVNGNNVYGAYQDITTMDDGNDYTGSGDPMFQLDFRHVYGEIINKWFGQTVGNTNTILGGGFSYTSHGILT